MQYWQEYRNFRKTANNDGTYTYIITVGCKDVEVTKELYRAYAKGAYKMEYMEHGLKRDRIKKDANGKAIKDVNGIPVTLSELEVSLNKLIEENWDLKSLEQLPEDMILTVENWENKELHRCLSLLYKNEQALIDALFFKDMTDKEYAKKLGVTRQAVNKRKQYILKKIKSFWEQGC